MAGTYTLNRKASTVWGNLRIKIYDVTNFTNSETLTITGAKTVYAAIPTVNAASASVGTAVSGNVVTFSTAADSYDGQLIVLCR
jgi:hypothetical protein